MSAQAELARHFEKLHREGPLLLLPNVWDAMSARLFAAAGFAALATTSGGVAWALGYADGEQAPWPEIVAATARIVRAAGAGMPVTADIEAGYAATPQEVEVHVGQILKAGVVGINLEDGGREAPLRPIAEATARIAAARAAADAAGVPLVINARVDAFFRLPDGEGRFAEAVRRAHAYLEAGATCIYPFLLREPASIAAFTKEVAAPVNILGGATSPKRPELERLGVRRVTLGTAPALVVASQTRKLALALKAEDFTVLAPDVLTHSDMQQLFAPQGAPAGKAV